MSKHDRLDMIKKISFIHNDDISVFENYIPDHYNEIYSLYSLLSDAKIDYNDIKFNEPIIDSELTFVLECKPSISESIIAFINKIEYEISYLRKHSYSIKFDCTSGKGLNKLLMKFVEI